MKALLVILAAAVLLGSQAWPPQKPAAPLAGFSFSPLISVWANRDPAADLGLLLRTTNPDIVRLPVYWESVEPTPTALDFSSIDSLLAVVAEHNLSAPNPTRVVLTIGARNFLYPELHEPAWAGPRSQPFISDVQVAHAYHTYIDASISRYRASSLLYAWQVENEAFDYVGNAFTGYDEITPEQVAWEVGEVHRLDPAHKAVTTTFDGWNVGVDQMQLYAAPLLWLMHGYPSGHPEQALEAGDALGLDLYVDGPSTPFKFAGTGLLAQWKSEAVAFWVARAHSMGKDVWLAEMQAQPWYELPGNFTTADLVASARQYRQDDLQVVLLWGVETWLYDPAWLDAGRQAIAILRS